MPVSRRGTEAFRFLSRNLLDDPLGFLNNRPLLFYRLLHKPLMGISMIPDLMPGIRDPADHFPVMLCYEARYIECRLHLVLVQQVKYHIHTAVRPVLPDRTGAYQLPGVRLVRRHVPPDNIPVQIKTEHDRASLAFRPLYSLHHIAPLCSYV